MRKKPPLDYGGKKKPDYARRQRYRFSRRALLVGAGQAGLFGLLGWRLHQLQILDSSEYRLLSDENRMTVQLVAPARGSIYDRFGAVIAENKENLRLLVLPAFCKSLPGTLNSLSKIVPISAATRDRVLRAARRQSGYYPVLVAEGLSWRQFALLNILAPQIPGMRTDRSGYRHYNHARPMSHVVGYVGMAGKAEVDLAPVMRLPGFRTGITGVEKSFDKELRGSPGTIKYEVDVHGRVVRELGSKPSTRGRDLVLTIDHHLQTVALDRIKEHRVASVVLMDVATGGILAMASTPAFDPNLIAFNPDPEQWKELAKARDHPLHNRAIRGQYPPGSTFKVVTALAGLSAGVIDPRGDHALSLASMRSGARASAAGKPMARASTPTRRSSSLATSISTRRRSAPASSIWRRQRASSAWGGPMTAVSRARNRASFPTRPGNAPELFQHWYPGETVIAGIGQGFVLATPLQLAVMVSRVATGRAVLPKLVMSANDPIELFAGSSTSIRRIWRSCGAACSAW